MSDKRLPKPGEAWITRHDQNLTRTVVNAYSDAVTYQHNGRGPVSACTLDDFLDENRPPEPTVVDSSYLRPAKSRLATIAWNVFPAEYATHRLDLMSDGEFRVVKL